MQPAAESARGVSLRQSGVDERPHVRGHETLSGIDERERTSHPGPSGKHLHESGFSPQIVGQRCNSPAPEREGTQGFQIVRRDARLEFQRALRAPVVERRRLPDTYRAVFVLRALEELSVEETATALDIPEGTVRTRFFRARGLLREAISREVDMALDSAFGFAGERCDRIVARVLARLAAAS